MLMLTGTLFVLMKDPSPKQQLLDAVTSQSRGDSEVQELIEQLQSQNPEKRPAASFKTQGKWRLLWSLQVSSTVGKQYMSTAGKRYMSTAGKQYMSIAGKHCKQCRSVVQCR